ncbi:hypothetical protein [Streptomyces sp. YIM 98790]|uniref:hypothetical protein n=1 Tax=Streptomyces sp. YIM 98790 TaxID=2689077 RepID=UPI00140DADF5|nr:hypothetical protein [Streptomyces sp. YIM 98790]
MSRRRRPGGGRFRLGPFALAGWLFADLLLVLTLVALGGQPDPLAAKKPEETETEDPEPEEPDAPEEPEGPRSVDRNPVEFSVRGSDNGDLRRQIAEATEEWPDREAAFVLTFGGDYGGNQYAAKVNGLLHAANPKMFAAELAGENYHDLSEPVNTAVVRVYFYTHGG